MTKRFLIPVMTMDVSIAHQCACSYSAGALPAHSPEGEG